MAESRINTECSLTASEGISRFFKLVTLTTSVPSLQVRVYRIKPFLYVFVASSITASEGISFDAMNSNLVDEFPHCK